MDVDSFIGLYGPVWKRLDDACAGGPKGLARRGGAGIDEAIGLYLQVSGHLADVQTRYRDPALEAYLNGLVQRANAAIYGARPRTARGFVATFGARYREAVRTTAPFIAFAAVLVVAITLASALWVANSRGAQTALLPPQARDAIAGANGHRVDQGLASPALSTYILVNNLRVAILAFATGIAYGVGTVYLLVQNALLLGVLAGAFTAAGKAGSFWALILPHGLLELTAICVSAGAGLRIGWALIDPGDRRRSVALQEEAAQAVMVLVGVVPAFVVAALIEGFLTGSSVPAPFTLAIGAAVWLGYLAFVFGPILVDARRRRDARPTPAHVPAATAVPAP